MKESERRTSPRTACEVPVQFRVVMDGSGAHQEAEQSEERSTGESLKALAVAQGTALNLSEEGIYFTSPEHVAAGQELEIYLRLPTELTGRGAEQVRCRARVVHVDLKGKARGIVARVDRFEALTSVRNWSH